jgi:hypothetical protein
MIEKGGVLKSFSICQMDSDTVRFIKPEIWKIKICETPQSIVKTSSNNQNRQKYEIDKSNKKI